MLEPPLLDVHVLLSEDTRPEWKDQCLESIYAAIAAAPYGVQLQLIPGVPGHIGIARNRGYGAGTAPYATFVDDDDYLLPEAFTIVADALALKPDAVFPRELTLQNGKLCKGSQRHHLPIYRREFILDQSDYPSCGDVAQIVSMGGRDIIDIPTPVYVHRLYPDSRARELRRLHPDEFATCLQKGRDLSLLPNGVLL